MKYYPGCNELSVFFYFSPIQGEFALYNNNTAQVNISLTEQQLPSHKYLTSLFEPHYEKTRFLHM